MNSPELFRTIVRVAKSDSAFLYFQLEANEGLCFYSTLNHVTGEETRDILIQGTREFEPEVKRLLKKLNEYFPIQYLEPENI